jgi:hypothetical protein
MVNEATKHPQQTLSILQNNNQETDNATINLGFYSSQLLSAPQS